MSETGRILGYIGLSVAGVLICLALGLILGRALWRMTDYRRRNRRGGYIG